MARHKLIVEYDGSTYSGWQRQANARSVQQALEEAARRFDPTVSLVAGAGRTDAGVHARGQVAHVDLKREWAGWRLREAFNAHLADAFVSVVDAEPVDGSFDARRSAVARHYRYEAINRRASLTFARGRAWLVRPTLDVEAMHAAAQALVGRHDFSTFRDAQCQAKSPLRTLDYFRVSREGQRVMFDVGARSFLHRQVRSMVGSLVQVGLGRWSADALGAALAAADRARCGPVAPPDGLYLECVDYD